MNEKEFVILVDPFDNELGQMEKMEAHISGSLHRAFSILLFNEKGEMLMQKRSNQKYHCGGLWTNSCCSHPRPGESLEDACVRRLREELGITNASPLLNAFHFVYKTPLDKGLYEHELDHVFVGHYSEAPTINPEEVSDWAYINMHDLRANLKESPHRFTPWLHLILQKLPI